MTMTMAICDLRFAICDLRFAICDLGFGFGFAVWIGLWFAVAVPSLLFLVLVNGMAKVIVDGRACFVFCVFVFCVMCYLNCTLLVIMFWSLSLPLHLHKAR